MLSAAGSQSINCIEINVYLLTDLTRSRRRQNHTIGCQLDICAFIPDSKCGMIYREDSSNEVLAEDMVRFV
jgi:hypothetical protein